MGCGIAAAEEHGGITAKKRHIFVTAENGAPVRAVHILIISAILKSANGLREGACEYRRGAKGGCAQKRRSGNAGGKKNFCTKTV